MANWIKNAGALPFGSFLGDLPDVGDALVGWFQPLTIQQVVKETSGFQVVETTVETHFQGVIQPLKPYELSLKPEGERDWDWRQVHSDPSLQLKNDDVILYLGKQYRVMSVGDYAAYGYMLYHIQEDYTGAGPTVVTP